MCDVKTILNRYNNDPCRLMDIFLDIQSEDNYVSGDTVKNLSESLQISEAEINQTLSFYHFFSDKHAGKYRVYLNNSAVANMKGRSEIKETFEKEAGCKFGSVTDDGLIGLFNTACIGMNDQEPAAIINNTVFTSLTVEKTKEIVSSMRRGIDIKDMVKELGEGNNKSETLHSMVNNNIRKRGEVIFSEFKKGSALKKAVSMENTEVIKEIKNSNLRGRGGAGFPTGMKLDFCSKEKGSPKYIICNADEGEPGTFKDRVILTEIPELVFEGMTIAAYAAGANEGIVYLRGEYRYLSNFLEDILDEFRKNNLLGNDIAGKKGFNFDIRIQFGAGAYICGEESALIESAEGKRGEPRVRPPFPVQAGYLEKPTVVNNVETLCNISKIIEKGADWFKSFGTGNSAGTKLLSISGDCEKPGIYEVEWGVSINDILELSGAVPSETKAVQVGGPSGTCIEPAKFSKTLCFSDLATGGSIIIIGKKRNLLEIVENFMEFFCDESCGSCAPCRIGNLIIRNKIQKIRKGSAVQDDLDQIIELGKFMKTANRCGLGQTSANPAVTTITNFRSEYDNFLNTDTDFDSGFDLTSAVEESCKAAGREPNL